MKRTGRRQRVGLVLGSDGRRRMTVLETAREAIPAALSGLR
jgi:hypothetical protein